MGWQEAINRLVILPGRRRTVSAAAASRSWDANNRPPLERIHGPTVRRETAFF